MSNTLVKIGPEPVGDAHPQVLNLAQARTLLAEVRSLDWVKQLRDQAEAVRVYAKQAQLGAEAEKYANEIKVRAEVRMGELTRALPEAPSGQVAAHMTPDARESYEPKSRVLKAAGLSTQRVSEWERVAEYPPEAVDAAIEQALESGKHVTTAGILKTLEQQHAPAKPIEAQTPPKSYYWNLPFDCPQCEVQLRFDVVYNPATHEISMDYYPAEKEGHDWFPEEDA